MELFFTKFEQCRVEVCNCAYSKVTKGRLFLDLFIMCIAQQAVATIFSFATSLHNTSHRKASLHNTLCHHYVTEKHCTTGQAAYAVPYSANCACAVPLIDGLGYNLLASSSRRGRHRLVDSMRESIHDLRCDFLCLQDTQSKRTRPRRGMAVLINPRRACAARVTVVVLSDCVDAYSDTTGYEAVHQRYQRIQPEKLFPETTSFERYAVKKPNSTGLKRRFLYNYGVQKLWREKQVNKPMC